MDDIHNLIIIATHLRCLSQ